MISLSILQIYERFCMRDWLELNSLNMKLIALTVGLIPYVPWRFLIQKTGQFSAGWFGIVKGNWSAIL